MSKVTNKTGKHSQGIQWVNKDGNHQIVAICAKTDSEACEEAVIEAFAQGWRPCIPALDEKLMNLLAKIEGGY